MEINFLRVFVQSINIPSPTRYDPDSNAGDGYYDLPKDHKLEYLNLSLDSSMDDMARYNDFDLKWGLLGK